MIDVLCVKQGTKYGPGYVNRLAAGVARHLSLPYRFLCMTDDPTGLQVESKLLPDPWPGWWAKISLFRPRPNRVLYIDLDSVIVGSLDDIASYSGNFAILRDFYRPNGYGSAVMSLRAGTYASEVWRDFTPGVPFRLHGDQNWVEEKIPKVDFWQDLYPGQIVSYKCHIQKTGRIPANARIVCFHGQPKNADLPKGDPLRHLWEHAA